MTGHPMLDAAGELAILHQTREHTLLRALEDIDWQRTSLKVDINGLVVLTTPIPFPATRPHTRWAKLSTRSPC